jgi:hypothetical protein
MAKKKISKKYNTPINIYAKGEWLKASKEAWGDAMSAGNIGGSIGNTLGAASSIVGTGVSNAQIADTSGIEGQIDAAKSYVVGANNNDALMSEWGAWSPMESVHWEDIRGGSTGQRLADTLGAAGSGASTGAMVGSPIGAVVGGAAGLISGLVGWITGGSKAKEKARKLNEQIGYANASNLLALEDRAEAIDMQNDLLTLANYAANGGRIYIKPQNRGKFADNARKWKHELGGNLFNDGGLMHQHGGIFSNDVITIGNGGTHEENPFEGVQIGVDSQGIPNMVEEGEVIWNDYVFSNRLKPTQEFKDKYKVKGETFADVAKEMQKESEERPNDPISQRGLVDSMVKLQQAQETVRQKKQASQEGKKYAYGGKKGKLYGGDGPYTNFLDDEDGGGNVIGYTKNGILMDDGSIATYGSPEYEAASEYGLPEGATTRSVAEDVSDTGSNLSWLRYAPIAGSALGVIGDLFSKPDYSNANLVMEAANKAGEYLPVGYTPIGNYLDYTPFDRSYYINKLAGQAGATRKAIVNQSAGNRATAMAGLLAADYNAQGKYGDLIRQAEEFNLAQRQAVEQFNRATNQANAEMGLQASRANQAARQAAAEARLKGVTQAAALRDAEDKQRAASRSANLSGLFTNLGNVGTDILNRADRDFYIKHVMGANLPLEEYRRLYGLDAAKKEAKKRGFTDNEITKLFKNGGQLKKKRGGFTY